MLDKQSFLGQRESYPMTAFPHSPYHSPALPNDQLLGRSSVVKQSEEL